MCKSNPCEKKKEAQASDSSKRKVPVAFFNRRDELMSARHGFLHTVIHSKYSSRHRLWSSWKNDGHVLPEQST